MVGTQTHAPLAVPAHDVAVPRSISEPARAMLAAGPIPWPPRPALDDRAGRIEWIAAADANMAAMNLAAGFEDAVRHERCDIAGVPTFRIEPPAAPEATRVLIDIHGGGFVAGGGPLCLVSGIRASGIHGAIVYAPDYRLPPDHVFPAALYDCMSVYRAVVDRHGAGSIVVQGSSAGGNLAAALMLRLAAEGVPLPAGLLLHTPALDMTCSGDSFQTNRHVDTVLGEGLGNQIDLYAGGAELSQPYLSPLFGDLSRGFPPTWISAGTRDLFLSNAVRMHRRLIDAGCTSELQVYEAMPHGGFFGAEEDMSVAGDQKVFADRCWRVAEDGRTQRPGGTRTDSPSPDTNR